MLRPDDTLQFYTSPYLRTRETTTGMLSELSTHPNYNKTKIYEEPRLREQDFGNFQPCSAEMERIWHERAAYGHFFYRIPNGESAADAYDRVSGFNETLWRQFADDDCASVLVLVTHGLMTRVFLMKWCVACILDEAEGNLFIVLILWQVSLLRGILRRPTQRQSLRIHHHGA